MKICHGLPLPLVLALTLSMNASTAFAQEPAPHSLTKTRELRRVKLTLTGAEPTLAEYNAVLSAANPTASDAYIAQRIDEWIESPEFYEQLMVWAHDLMPIGSYDENVDNRFKAHNSTNVEVCPQGSTHAGAVGVMQFQFVFGREDGDVLCNDVNADIRQIEPWWAPGTTIAVIGAAGAPFTEINDPNGSVLDCGRPAPIMSSNLPQVASDGTICSCGPHLTYCDRPNELAGILDREGEKDNHNPNSQRRALFEEPSRLLAQIVIEEKPFSDVVLASYTVMNRGLGHFYVRMARSNGEAKDADGSRWFDAFPDNTTWIEKEPADLSPYWSNQDTVLFDPRIDSGPAPALPFSGVLTTAGSLSSYARERVRAARWLESFACREFIPPPPTVLFGPFERDPATDGACQHCHRLIDPVAIHFKRFFVDGTTTGGLSGWQFNQLPGSISNGFNASFLHDTKMTPATEAEIIANPDARFIDFLPITDSVFGVVSDGTIGPRGFAKMLVESGEFDTCSVRRVYQQFGGRYLDSGEDGPIIDDLVDEFIGNGRNVKQLIRYIMSRAEFQTGH